MVSVQFVDIWNIQKRNRYTHTHTRTHIQNMRHFDKNTQSFTQQNAFTSNSVCHLSWKYLKNENSLILFSHAGARQEKVDPCELTRLGLSRFGISETGRSRRQEDACQKWKKISRCSYEPLSEIYVQSAQVQKKKRVLLIENKTKSLWWSGNARHFLFDWHPIKLSTSRPWKVTIFFVLFRRTHQRKMRLPFSSACKKRH